MEKRLLNIKEASEYLGIPMGSLYKLAWQKRLPFVVKIGRSLRFDKEKMDEWIEENTLKMEIIK
ncbi:helix-turn-helix domain-containing protein [Candidatus Calescamantes bacterium]|nr:helix-turn-helix domain-containing protein [Candidatus Calescamantes bacterium]